jgi:hypothetical protein
MRGGLTDVQRKAMARADRFFKRKVVVTKKLTDFL